MLTTALYSRFSSRGRGRLREPAALRDAQAVRRARGEDDRVTLEVEVLPGRGGGRRRAAPDVVAAAAAGGRRRARAVHASPSPAGARRGRCSRALDGTDAMGAGHDLPGRRARRARRRSRSQPDAPPAQPPAGGAADVRPMPVSGTISTRRQPVRAALPSARPRAPRPRSRRPHRLARSRRPGARRRRSRRRRHGRRTRAGAG